jgi:arsenite oxidase small subunit
MSRESKISRRSFVKLCASAAAVIGANPKLLAQADGEFHRHHRARLMDADGRPVTPSRLKVGENYLFHYPYVATPCFLLNLGRPTERDTLLQTEKGKSYRWVGGVGPQRSVVAFSAICAHKMSYPADEVSFINYRHQAVSFRNKDQAIIQRSQVIYCCSEKSVYDPLQGGRVLGGPAPQPLAAILLEHDESDGSLYAAGIYGGEMLDQFFEKFSFRLSLEFKTANIREEVAGTTTVMPLTQYCRTQVLC